MEFLNKKRNNDEDSETEEYIPTKTNDNNNEIQKLKNQMNDINKIIKTSRQEIRSLHNKVNNLIFKNEGLYNENHKLSAEINELKLDNKKLIKEINDLKWENNKLRMLIEELQIKNEILEIKNDSLEKKIERQEKEIASLSQFVFKAKLRKLLKKLLQFIIKKYFSNYMKYNQINKKIYFTKAPLIYGLSEYDIIIAMNKMLEIIFGNVKENNFAVHFVDKEVMKNDALKKKVEVFRDSKDFFNYFNIPQSQEKIIKKLIPSFYFTAIDNFSFDLNIEDILNKCKYYK